MMKVFAAAVLLAVGCHARTVNCGTDKIQDGHYYGFKCVSPFSVATLATQATFDVTTPGVLCEGAKLEISVGNVNEGTYYVNNGFTLTLNLPNLQVNNGFMVYVTNLEKTCDADVTVTMTFSDPTPAPFTPRPVPVPVPGTPSPPAPGQLCPTKVGTGEVAVTSCGAAVCRATQHLPLGSRFEMCDPCVTGPLGVYATIERSGSNYVVQWEAGSMSGSTTIECGQCITMFGNSASAACQSSGGGLAAGAIVGIVVGVLVIIAAVGGGVFLWRRNAARSEGNAFEGTRLVQ